MTTASILILVALLHLATSHTLTSLTFGKDTSSYILMEPDFTPIAGEFTVCAWIKRMSNHNGHAQYWFSYITNAHDDEIVVSDGALYYLFLNACSYQKPSLTTGEWHHICATYSYSDLMKRVYYDGVQIGSESAPSDKKVRSPGSLILGQVHYVGGNIGSNRYFGGTMFGTTVYSTELSPDQIQQMYTQGRCAGDSIEGLSDVTVLSWQDILEQERQGNVVEEELECDAEHDHPDEDDDADQNDSADDDTDQDDSADDDTDQDDSADDDTDQDDSADDDTDQDDSADDDTDQDDSADDDTDQDDSADDDTDQDDSAEDADTDHSQFRKNQSTRVVITCGYFCTICYIFIVMKIFGI